MTITKHDGFAILPKRCNTCNRLFWLESYDIYYKEVGIEHYSLKQIKCLDCISELKVLERFKQLQLPHKMTVEEYRQRMIRAFHNADTHELIAICVPPTEKDFKHLEWLLKNYYKKEPCEEREQDKCQFYSN